jgi:protein-tyrosine phosphatase
MPSVLFVCTANICRSPMAMVLFQDYLKADGKEWRIDSAGTWSMAGADMAQKTRMVLAGHGHSPGKHSSKPVDDNMLAEYDLILTMEQGHKEALKIEFPDHAHKVFQLSEMLGQNYDIPDPIGKSMMDFEETYSEIRQILHNGYLQIEKLATKNKEMPLE